MAAYSGYGKAPDDDAAALPLFFRQVCIMNESLRSFPVKCATCESLAQAPVACAECHSLLEHVSGADYFELFGLDRRFDLAPDDIQRKYLAVARNIHPDAFVSADQATQQVVLRLSSAVNKAYETLRDPVRRAEYLLELSGGKSAAEDKRVPPELLAEVMLLREEIEEARAGGDTDTIAAIRPGIAGKKVTAMQRIAELCRRITADSDTSVHDDLRLQLNSIKYFDNLLAQLA